MGNAACGRDFGRASVTEIPFEYARFLGLGNEIDQRAERSDLRGRGKLYGKEGRNFHVLTEGRRLSLLVRDFEGDLMGSKRRESILSDCAVPLGVVEN